MSRSSSPSLLVRWSKQIDNLDSAQMSCRAFVPGITRARPTSPPIWRDNHLISRHPSSLLNCSRFNQTMVETRPKLFLTGATGYIGGSVFSELTRLHPEYHITVLLRKPPANLQTQYSNVNIIQGSFDDAELIASAAAGADIVIHSGDGDHENALKAIIRGLLRRDRKSFLIKLSGTGLLYEYPNTTEYLGQYNPKAYSDVEDIAELVSRPDDALHRRTDAIVLNAAAEHGHMLKTAIVCPPDIYGRGYGPGRRISYYIPWFVEAIQKLGNPFYLDAGSNMRGWVHIQDLVQIYIALVEAAAAGGGEVSWGSKGYFLAASQEFSQKEIAEATGRILHGKGLLPSAQAQSISREDMAALFPYAPETGYFSFCCNSRSKPDRAARELGYVAKGPSFWDTLETDLLDALATKQ
ncbi:NAD(P)-binding protein [Xylariaceae sp. FL1272]|nr:NAD(P)-binding protein [Xylariaceae sp. FL1272]